MSYSRNLSMFCFFCCFFLALTITISLLFSSRSFADHDAEEIERLVKQLGSDSFREREAAMESIRRFGKTALPALRKAQSSSDPEIRRRAKLLLDQIEVTVQSLLKRHASIRYYKNQKPSPASVREVDLVGNAFSDNDLMVHPAIRYTNCCTFR